MESCVTVFIVQFVDCVVIKRDEATPCGDGMVKGVKVAWPGSGGQREEFPHRSIRRDRFAVAQRVACTHTRTRTQISTVVSRLARLSRVHLVTRRRSLDASPDASRMILVRPRRFICAFGSLTRRLVADRDEAPCFRPAAAAAVVATAAVTAVAATATSGMLAAVCDIIICLLRRSGWPRSIIRDL